MDANRQTKTQRRMGTANGLELARIRVIRGSLDFRNLAENG
jgi:hypothetical protein